MTTLQRTLASSLQEPVGDDRIDEGALEYIRTRNRMHLYTRVWSEFERADIKQSTLAARLGKGEGRISRLLGAPGNWTLDTVSELLFAISGGTMDLSVAHLMAEPPRNMRNPVWFRNGAPDDAPDCWIALTATRSIRASVELPHKGQIASAEVDDCWTSVEQSA